MPRRLLLIGAFCLVLVGLAAAATFELNHPTGTKGLFLVDKLGAHLRFFDPTTYTEIANIEARR